MKYNLITVLVGMFCLASSALAQEKPSLKDLFDGKVPNKVIARASSLSDTIVINLSEWENEYDETLNIHDGKNYKFMNGHLKWIGGNTDPLLIISNNSFVEFAAGDTVSSVNTNCALIELKGAKVLVSGATIGGPQKKYPAGYTAGVWGYNDAFHFDMETCNKFTMTSGYISTGICNETEKPSDSSIRIDGGEFWGIRSNLGLTISGDIFNTHVINQMHSTYSCSGIRLGNNGIIFLTSKVLTSGLAAKNLLSKIYCDSIYDGRKIIVGSDYTITENDLANVAVGGLDDTKYELVLENNAIIIKAISDEISTEDDLQTRINATVGYSSAAELATIRIPDDGITLTKPLNVPFGAYVNLVGGKLIVSEDYPSTADMVVNICGDAVLRIDSLTWDANTFESYYSTFLVEQNAKLIFGDKVNVNIAYIRNPTTKRCFVYNEGEFINYSAYIYINDGLGVSGSVKYGNTIFYGGDVFGIKNKNVTLNGGTIMGDITSSTFTQNGGCVKTVYVLNSDYLYLYGGDMAAGGFNVANSACLEGGNVENYDYMYYAKDLTIGEVKFYDDFNFTFLTSGTSRSENIINFYRTNPLDINININSDWQNYDFSSDVLVVQAKNNYSITADDLNNFNFVDLPAKIHGKVKEKDIPNNTIVLQKKRSLGDIFGYIDPNGTEENPSDVLGEEDEVDVDEPEETGDKPSLAVYFGDKEDVDEGTETNKLLTFYFNGEYGIQVSSNTTAIFKNINVAVDEGQYINSLIDVYGTLVIGSNVNFLNVDGNVDQVICLHKDGKVIIRGGSIDLGSIVEKDGGRIIYESGHFTTDGSTKANIYIESNKTVYVTDQIKSYLSFWWLGQTSIDYDVPLVAGEGYTLTEYDLENIFIGLPSGCYLNLDTEANAIYIVNPNAISDISSGPKTKYSYSLSGVRTYSNAKDIYIRDGKKYLNK